MAPTITLVLGAGASRAVSYASQRRILSPLDSDFFELLQKIEPTTKDEPAVLELIQWILTGGDGIWSSMERTFYTLYMRARMSEVLFPNEKLEADVAGCSVASHARSTPSCERRIAKSLVTTTSNC